MAKHTPGPWRLERGKGTRSINGGRIVANDGRQVAGLTIVADKPLDQKEADGRLIASAPDLLAALSALVEAHPLAVSDSFKQARAAIASAMG